MPAKKSMKKSPAKKKAPAKKAPKKSNLEILHEAGVLRPGSLAKHNPAVIKKLSADEVKTLVKLRKKLGALDEGGDGDLSPNFPV